MQTSMCVSVLRFHNHQTIMIDGIHCIYYTVVNSKKIKKILPPDDHENMKLSVVNIIVMIIKNDI